MADSTEVIVARIETALVGIDGQSGLVGDVKALTKTVAAQNTRIDAVDRKATRATWWSKLPTVVLVAVGGLAGVWKQWLE